MLLKLLPAETKVSFMKLRFAAMILSLLALAATIMLIPMRGLNLGIDFTGGVLVEFQTKEPIDINRLRSMVESLEMGSNVIQHINDPQFTEAETVALVRVEGEAPIDGDVEKARQDSMSKLKTALSNFYEIEEFRRTEVVGPKVSGELFRSGITALAVALSLMLIYIWFRFEWQFSLGAVLALTHDVLLTIGMFTVTQFEFNLATIAALLTIIGYSMNDTVVVFDRVREEMRKYKKMPMVDLINLALNRTLSRTMLTSVTTLLALLSIFFFGGSVLRGFSFALIWGVVIGTYSSIFVASTALLYTGVRRDLGEPREEPSAPV